VTVYLVGAGPGDPGLLTARAIELISSAEVIVYDRLIPAEALGRARADAELIFVGKQVGSASMPQAEINDLLVEHGRTGRSVIRLKGGDPFVFGRGGEEAEVLRAAGIDFEVVPGITAGVAAPAYAGIPVTHRGLASGVAFITGHEDPDKPDSALDWSALAAFPGTIVVYMGVRQLESITDRLQAAGRDREQPAAVVERGTLTDQRVISGTLATVAAEAAAAGLRAGDRRDRGGRGPAGAPSVVGAAPVGGGHRRRHSGPRPGKRAGHEARLDGGCGRPGAGDQDRGAGRARPGPWPIRPRLPDQPERREAVVRALEGRR
jgi:uroporphyrinogen III methyltransferase/synthase